MERTANHAKYTNGIADVERSRGLCISRLTRLPLRHGRWLCFLGALLALSAFAHAPAPKIVFPKDGDNRLVQMTSATNAPSGSRQTLLFSYDWQGRRIQKIVSTWNGSDDQPSTTNKYLYDGWNLVAELNGTNGLVRSYLWGSDLLKGSPFATSSSDRYG